MNQHILDLGKTSRLVCFFLYSPGASFYLPTDNKTHLCCTNTNGFMVYQDMGQGANPLPLEKHHDSAQPHLGQQVQTDQTIYLTPNALPSLCKLAYQQQALRLRQQNTSATTDILVRAGRGRGFSSFAPGSILFHVLCKTASSQCLLMVSAGWQLVPQGAFASTLITGG